uniref:Uncharacterized protein n=1 Tax=viral metagenome TaxID=1070528 RepID=A0A6M3JKP3_9ZZZZ
MSFEQLKNIIDWNKEQNNLYPIDKDLENNMCPYDAWQLDENSEGYKSCPICGRIWHGGTQLF